MSMDRELLVENIVRVAKTAKAYGLPVVVSTVNVKTGRNKPMINQLEQVLAGIEPLDRTTSVETQNAKAFLQAMQKYGRVRRRDGASRWGVFRDLEQSHAGSEPIVRHLNSGGIREMKPTCVAKNDP